MVETRAMYHLRCGDDIFETLAAAGVPGTPLCWLDPLGEGPTPGGLGADDFRALRAGWAAERFDLDRVAVLGQLEAQDQALDDAVAAGGELVLWCDHTLIDQMVLVHLLDRLWSRAAGRLSLICLNRHPDVRRFFSLGQLAPESLAALFPRRRRISAAQAALAGEAWRAFSARDPERLETLIDHADFAPLPFLRAALDRHRRQYPWRQHGLTQTEAWCLQAVLDGADTPEAVCERVREREAAPWQSTAMITACLTDLIEASEPLVVRTPERAGGVTLAPTEVARATLAGERRAARRERWLGGVHLTPDGPDWRWDRRLVREDLDPGRGR